MMNLRGINIIASSYTVNETINRLVTLLHINGATIYARINQQKELQNTGTLINPYEVILFGNPNAGGPVLVMNAIAGLDLPLKIISWEDEKNKVWVAYKDCLYLAERYNLSAALTMPLDLSTVITKALQ